jgi:general secretion pathway protein E
LTPARATVNLRKIERGFQLVDTLATLTERGLVAADDVARARALAEQSRLPVPSVLVRLGMLSERDLAAALAESHGLPLAARSDLPALWPAAEGLNGEYLMRRHVFPIELADGALALAMADPDDGEALTAMCFAYDADRVQPVVATYSDIADALAQALPSSLGGAAPAEDLSASGEDLERLAESDSDAPVIRLVQRLLANAAARRASDVHIEPMARHVCVRYRVDGRLQEVEWLPDTLGAPVASRIKVMAGLDIAETRLPQDGRLRLTVQGLDIDVRVSTSPISYGESIVMRLLGRSTVPLELNALGLPEGARLSLERALSRPNGIILLTGPTGSGKTTTLYAAINRLRRPDVKILTVEDPVEILLEGVNQVQVRPEIDLTYANALRAFLRQDPDILMIGEIRDRETADIAMRAALTGHLVLSTLHTQSAIGAFTRLADIGIEPFLTASTVIATIAQRLVRALCPRCSEPRPLDDRERALFERFGHTAPPDQLMVAKGCPACGGTGYHGRVPIMEIFEVDEAARAAIHDNKTEALEAHRRPADTLFGHGLALVAQGKTDLVEIERAVSAT